MFLQVWAPVHRDKFKDRTKTTMNNLEQASNTEKSKEGEKGEEQEDQKFDYVIDESDMPFSSCFFS